MNELIGADQKIDLFEFMLQRMVQRYLDGYFGSTKERKLITMISQLSVPCETILSAVAYIGTEDFEAEAALRTALTSLGLRSPTVIDKHFSLAKLEGAFTLLNDGDFDLRSAVVKAATQIVLHDGKVTLEEKQLLIALADALEAKIPPEVFFRYATRARVEPACERGSGLGNRIAGFAAARSATKTERALQSICSVLFYNWGPLLGANRARFLQG